MSDPSAVLQPAILALLAADAGVLAAFTASAKPVRVFDFPPTNGAEPYVVVGELLVVPQIAECLDGAETEATLHIWSRTDPPGKAEAQALGAALVAALCPVDAAGLAQLPSLVTPGYRLTATRFVRASYLNDLNKPETAHGVVVIGLSTDPL